MPQGWGQGRGAQASPGPYTQELSRTRQPRSLDLGPRLRVLRWGWHSGVSDWGPGRGFLAAPGIHEVCGPGPWHAMGWRPWGLPGPCLSLHPPAQFFLLLLLVFLLEATIAILFFAYTDKVWLPRPQAQLQGWGLHPRSQGAPWARCGQSGPPSALPGSQDSGCGFTRPGGGAPPTLGGCAVPLSDWGKRALLPHPEGAP